MFENIINFFKNLGKKEKTKESSDTAKERLHLVLMQDRANVSADFLELMKQEIIEVIKKYIDIDEKAIDVRLTNKANDDGTVGAPALYANIPIITIKDEARKANVPHNKENEVKEEKNESDVKKELEEANKIKNEKKNEAIANVKEQDVKEDNTEKNNEKVSENKEEKECLESEKEQTQSELAETKENQVNEQEETEKATSNVEKIEDNNEETDKQ